VRWRRREDPQRYLEHALRLMHDRALVSNRVDWARLLPRLYALASDAQTVTDTYPAIALAVDELRRYDAHSFFQPARKPHRPFTGVGLAVLFPQCVAALVGSGGSADRAGVRPGDRLIAVDGKAPRANPRAPRLVHLVEDPEAPLRLTLRRGSESYDVTLQRGARTREERPTGQRLSVTDSRLSVGYLSLPGSGARRYAGTVRALRRRIGRVSGWVIDLRRHTGGNMWPVIAGLGPILGPGPVGAFVDADGVVTRRWSGSASRASVVPVAVLQGPLTGSSGEALVVSFRGRPVSRTFGQCTYGLPTANQPFALADGALLFLTTAREADRSGRVYDGPIEPDEHVDIDWAALGTPNDPVLGAAVAWLTTARTDT
jgi:carboxyl-terminal processing protease